MDNSSLWQKCIRSFIKKWLSENNDSSLDKKTIWENLNAFNVRVLVVYSNYKHVKVLCNGTW